MKLYDGEEVGDWKLAQIPEIKRAADHEGMSGLGPRAIVDVLSGAARRAGEEHHTGKYLTPIMALIALTEYIERLEAPKETREQLRAFVVDARKEIDRRLKDEVRKAFVPAFAEHAQELLENYLTNIEAYCQGTKTQGPDHRRGPRPRREADARDRGEGQAGGAAVGQGHVPPGRADAHRDRAAPRRPAADLPRPTRSWPRASRSTSSTSSRTSSASPSPSTNPDKEQAKRLNEVLTHPDRGARLQRALRARPARLRRPPAELADARRRRLGAARTTRAAATRCTTASACARRSPSS